MPLYFPTPRPDELLYSLLSRYHWHTSTNNVNGSLNDLFGISKVRVSMDLPSQLQRLAKHLPKILHLDVNDLIHRHTLFPLFATYADPANADKAYKAMCGQRSTNVHACFGMLASPVPSPSHLRYCPECNREQMAQYGELYWRRLFQVPGVLVCPVHNLVLQPSTVMYRPASTQSLVPALPANCEQDDIPGIHNTIPLLQDIAIECERLLNRPAMPESLNVLVADYRQKLLAAGFRKGKKHSSYIDQQSLKQCFRATIGAEVLQLLNLDFDPDYEWPWIKKITHKSAYKKGFHPILHILLQLFLNRYQAPDIPEPQPFGAGPWPCMNPVADHYGRNLISTVTIGKSNRVSGRIIGTFACQCGYSYQSYTPCANPEQDYAFLRVTSRGPVWYAYLKKLVLAGTSLSELARLMQTDRNTIKSCVAELGLELPGIKPLPCKVPSNGNGGPRSTGGDTNVRNKNRRKWLALRKQFPDMAKWPLGGLDRPTFRWLFTYDREWLESNSPQNSERKGKLVDWKKRDQEMLVLMQETVKDLLSRKRPVRISLYRLGSEAGKLAALQNDWNKMPETAKFIKDQLETIEQFQLRRIFFVARKLHEQHKVFHTGELKLLARIKDSYSAKLHQAVEDIAQSYALGEIGDRGELDWLEWRSRYF